MNDYIKYAWNNIRKRLLRSSLTILSIMIGIMAIFTLVSFGQGLSKYMIDTFESMGTDKIIMEINTFGPPGSSDVSFYDDDVDFIEKVTGVDVVTGLNFVVTDVSIKGERPQSAYVMGLSTESDDLELVKTMLTVDTQEGRFLKKDDRTKIVVGNSFSKANKIFTKALTIGDKIKIKEIDFEIVGIMESIGNPQDDTNIYMEQDYYNKVFGDGYSYIYIQAQKGANIEKLAETIDEKYRKHTNQEEGKENYYIQTFEDMMDTAGTVITTINVVVLVIALISIVVAAINITNTMYTSVLERTNEIGIMKAIGARNFEILKIFLIESAILGLIGGLLGMGLGYLISKFGEGIALSAGYGLLKPYFPLWLIMGCLIFAILVGMISGFLPAKQASEQKPVDSLRYE
jgi:putative ABC transport system permease protein